MITVDTREKKNAHILAYFDRHNVPYIIKKLDVGDYMTDANAFVSVDTKRSIDEVASNLLHPQDRARFWREIRRAKDTGIKLYILIESNKYRQVNDLTTWRSKYSCITGRAVINAIYRAHISYGLEFIFTPKISTARTIIEILEGNNGLCDNNQTERFNG